MTAGRVEPRRVGRRVGGVRRRSSGREAHMAVSPEKYFRTATACAKVQLLDDALLSFRAMEVVLSGTPATLAGVAGAFIVYCMETYNSGAVWECAELCLGLEAVRAAQRDGGARGDVSGLVREANEGKSFGSHRVHAERFRGSSTMHGERTKFIPLLQPCQQISRQLIGGC